MYKLQLRANEATQFEHPQPISIDPLLRFTMQFISCMEWNYVTAFSFMRGLSIVTTAGCETGPSLGWCSMLLVRWQEVADQEVIETSEERREWIRIPETRHTHARTHARTHRPRPMSTCEYD
jgi:hypothetical protein